MKALAMQDASSTLRLVWAAFQLARKSNNGAIAGRKMGRIGNLPIILVALSLVTCVIGNSPAQADDILANGGLELFAGPAGWTLTQSITGMPAAPISAGEHVDYAN